MDALLPYPSATRRDPRIEAHANVGFYYGAMLADPAGLLEGTGRRMRHVKLNLDKEPDVAALSDLIARAYADIRQRLVLVENM